MFSQVCLSGGGGCLPRCMPGYTPRTDTPLCSACWDTVNKWAVCTPLECILVSQASVIPRGGGCLPDTPLGRPPRPPHPADGYCCGWYVFYWNVFLYFDNNTFKSSHTRCVDNAPFLIVRICDVFVHYLCCTANNIKRSECIYLVKNLATCQ